MSPIHLGATVRRRAKISRIAVNDEEAMYAPNHLTGTSSRTMCSWLRIRPESVAANYDKYHHTCGCRLSHKPPKISDRPTSFIANSRMNLSKEVSVGFKIGARAGVSTLNNAFKAKIGLIILCILAGCEGTAPTRLKPVASSSILELKNDFVYEASYAIGVKWKHIVSSGTYTAIGEDDSGVFYRGPAECFSTVLLKAAWAAQEPLVNKVTSTADCGIYVPLRTGLSPKIFLVVGSGRQVVNGKLEPQTPSAAADDVTNLQIATSAAPRATPLQAGAGSAIGGGVVAAIVAAEQGNFNFYRDQPDPAALSSAIAGTR